MTRGSLAWFRYRMITGTIFSILGIVIAVRLVVHPAAPQAKIAGFGLAIVVIALGVVRIIQYVHARAAQGARAPQ